MRCREPFVSDVRDAQRVISLPGAPAAACIRRINSASVRAICVCVSAGKFGHSREGLPANRLDWHAARSDGADATRPGRAGGAIAIHLLGEESQTRVQMLRQWDQRARAVRALIRGRAGTFGFGATAASPRSVEEIRIDRLRPSDNSTTTYAGARPERSACQTRNVADPSP